MESEITELRKEIKILNERVNELEKSNNKRKAYAYFKAFVKICLILLTLYGLWWGYNYVSKELPKILDEKIKEIKPL